jgi:PAS domain S-box-containing protein
MARILVVDDEATITTHLEEKLSRFGYEVVGRASSGEAAVEIASSFKPDLVLMDIVMEGKWDGIEAARILKERWDIPSVFLTAYGDDQHISRSKNAEPLGYIIKPFQDSALKAAIELALYNKGVVQGLRRAEEQWRLLAENLQEGVILADEEERVFFWNKGASEIFGYKGAEAAGKAVTSLFAEGPRLVYRKEIQKYLLTGSSDKFAEWADVVGLRKDWSKFPLEICLTSMKIKEKIIFICLARDISAKKRAEDGIRASLLEKERLLEKVKEQVEGNLEAVYSLMDIQYEYLKEKKALGESGEGGERLKSVSLIQEKLSKFRATASIDFRNYLQNLTGRLFKSFAADPRRIKLRLDVDPVRLDVQTAMACGLIASELLSNSLRYAFPGNRKGEVVVEFRREGESAFHLVIKDNGVGLPKSLDVPSAKTMGFKIVNDIVARLGGNLKLDRRGGTKFKTTFRPAPSEGP